MNTKKDKGITLVALIVTILVLLILAVVAITTIGNTNIIEYANNAGNTYKAEQEKENIVIGDWEDFIEKIENKDNNVSCKHDGQRQTISVENFDDTYHLVTFYCYLCNSNVTEYNEHQKHIVRYIGDGDGSHTIYSECETEGCEASWTNETYCSLGSGTYVPKGKGCHAYTRLCSVCDKYTAEDEVGCTITEIIDWEYIGNGTHYIHKAYCDICGGEFSGYEDCYDKRNDGGCDVCGDPVQ